jgi:uncharacterized SAM-binding protein YcdF (DUF218 family)
MRRWDPSTPLRVLPELAPALHDVLSGARLSAGSGPADAIVVLGAAVLPDGQPSASLRARAEGAAALWRLDVAPCVVCTGAHHLRPPGEAVVAAGLLRAAGVPDAALLLDEKSRNTRGNLEMTRGLLPSARRIYVVTEPFHMGRSLWIARGFGFDPVPWPVRSRAWERVPARLRWLARDALSLALHRATAAG